jgi:hypothetical protein
MTQCGQFKDVAFRRHGILSCLDQLTVQFNQGQVTTMTNIHRAFEMTPEYYNGVAVDKHFPASLPDRFTNYNQYASSGAILLIH